MDKALHIYWHALRYYLTTTSRFKNLGSSLLRSCQDLIGRKLPPISVNIEIWNTLEWIEPVTQIDCKQVQHALDIVKINNFPSTCTYTTTLNTTIQPFCTNNKDSVGTLFFEDFEHSTGLLYNNWSLSNDTSSTWSYKMWNITSDLINHDGHVAFAPNPPDGNCQTIIESGQISLTTPILIAPTLDNNKPLLFSFEHAFATETNYDGGLLFISVNGQPKQFIHSAAFLYNSYPLNLTTKSTANPYFGKPAFTGGGSNFDYGETWAQSIINLNWFVKSGDSFQIHFIMSYDDCNGIIGWYIDNVKIYQCIPDPCTLMTCPQHSTCQTTPATSTQAAYGTCMCQIPYSGKNCDFSNFKAYIILFSECLLFIYFKIIYFLFVCS
jgi:hypothetical protein